MGTIADELNERSKFDDRMIVGSEIRAAIAELETEVVRLREVLKYVAPTLVGAQRSKAYDALNQK